MILVCCTSHFRGNCPVLLCSFWTASACKSLFTVFSLPWQEGTKIVTYSGSLPQLCCGDRNVLVCSVMSNSLQHVDCSQPGSSVLWTLQARILERVAILFSRGSSQPTDQTQVSHIAGRLFTIWATRKWKGRHPPPKAKPLGLLAVLKMSLACMGSIHGGWSSTEVYTVQGRHSPPRAKTLGLLAAL